MSLCALTVLYMLCPVLSYTDLYCPVLSCAGPLSGFPPVTMLALARSFPLLRAASASASGGGGGGSVSGAMMRSSTSTISSTSSSRVLQCHVPYAPHVPHVPVHAATDGSTVRFIAHAHARAQPKVNTINFYFILSLTITHYSLLSLCLPSVLRPLSSLFSLSSLCPLSVNVPSCTELS